MKNNVRPIFLAAFCFLLINMAFADKFHNKNGSKQSQNGNGSRVGAVDAEACSPATGHTDLDINNVRTRINTGGDMWWDLINISKYEIPKGSGKTSMFAGALWIGGIDINGQLKLAALEYRSYGVDYWPGPLSIDGYASVDAPTCEQYDQHYLITRAEVDQFIAHWKCPSCYPDYKIPPDIANWPAHGDITKNQCYYLAPFYDNGGTGQYDPNLGDYPYYDVNNSLCPYNAANLGKPPQPTMGTEYGCETGGVQADQCIKGDQTLWWVFNDKGNVHTESKGAPIGMEIRAQAFAFSTNDEINNMTFYSYEIINRSTYTLTETYMSQWCDPDLGFSNDDYVGCDIPRGMGYCYNGTDIDGSGQVQAYGANPPAIGMDFFQGPYMDPDGIDNPKLDASGHQMCDVSINGVNFGDGIVDNERFGMRRFIYFDNADMGAPEAISDPVIAIDYYNYLRGIWKDGTQMLWGGNAHTGGPGVCGPECDFMFPGNTDPCEWSTSGQPPNCTQNWTEKAVGNQPGDRRFLQSAGPFTLQPGAVNYITVGVPWARATVGSAWASVGVLDEADDKCQNLFNNCFKVVDGPDAPNLTIQELDKELILYINNKTNLNDPEKYREFDPSIVNPDTLIKQHLPRFDSLYRFEGYQIYQLANASVSVSNLQDPTQARLVAQCDIVNYDKSGNPIGTLTNYVYNEAVGANVPVQEVVGANTGIIHSFVITADQFATGVQTLVNHKQYYYMALSYAYNNYLTYSQDPNNQSTGILGVSALLGQQKPYLAGRKNIQVYTGIPHNPAPESNGTVQNAQYGFGPKITRIEGQGNGGNILDLTPESEAQILRDDSMLTPEYLNSAGPISVKVIDPLNVKKTSYTLCFDSVYSYKAHQVSHQTDIDAGGDTATMQVANWILIDNSNGDTIHSDTNTSYNNEQLFIDRGISIDIVQTWSIGGNGGKYELYTVGKLGGCATCDITAILAPNNGFLESSITYTDSSKHWLGGIPDIDGGGFWNWIRSGTNHDLTNPANNDYNYNQAVSQWLDPQKYYQKIINGTWAPYALCATNSTAVDPATNTEVTGYGIAYPGPSGSAFQLNEFENIGSVDIVLTSDPSKWSRCPVLETCEAFNSALDEGNTQKFDLRAHQSIALDQTTYATVGSGSSSNINDPNYIGESGMGWFPGYAINVETGERLNIIFGENSALGSENGKDMKFNPTSNLLTNLGGILWGGEHFVYIVGHNGDDTNSCPKYDAGKWIHNKLVYSKHLTVSSFARNAFKDFMYAGIPVAVPGQDWLSTDVKIRIRVSKPYKKNYSTHGSSAPKNKNNPMYQFSTSDIATVTDNIEAAKNALDLINVVPNPYYGFSGYEANQIDNEVKITNLPVQCTISIYTVNGTLVRQYTRDNPITTDLNWDLKNTAGVPIAGGLYLIYVNAPGIGEKVIKWFGTLRPIDLNSF
jgi:hypothetical protein